MGWFYCMKQQCRIINAKKTCGLSNDPNSADASYHSCQVGDKTITYEGGTYSGLCFWHYIVEWKPVE